MQKTLFIILLVLFFSCNNQPDQPASDQPQADSTVMTTDDGDFAPRSRSYTTAAIVPQGAFIDTTAKGDSIFLVVEDTTVSVPYTYPVKRIEIHPKKPTPPGTNTPPVARAGTDQILTLPTNFATLDGSATTDAENNIKSYGWRKTAGPTATIADSNKPVAKISNLVKGQYTYELRVADVLGAFTVDFITITVNDQVVPPQNKAPVARTSATPSTITLPANTVSLSAAASTDVDGTIASWLWTKVGGPPVGTIQNNANATTNVTGLNTAGTYQYKVIVKDNLGTEDQETINVIVNPAVEPPTGSTFPLSFTEIPVGDPDLNRGGAGAEQWHDRNDVNLGYTPSDVYWRFAATRIASNTKGVYNWSYLDNLFEQAKSRKQKVSFGIMTCYPGGSTDVGLVAFGGGTACYPQWLHNEMQAESPKDWLYDGTWTPNYNSAKYQTWLLELNKAINAHIYEKNYQGIVNAIDIRGYGAWGEWHSGYTQNNVVSDYPSGTFPTVASLKKIVDAHINGFPNFQLVCMIAAFDANYLGNTMNPPEIAHYILTHAGNNAGKIGWRRDQWGATDNYLKAYLENNTRSYNGVVFNTLIMDRWKFAPITGEPPAWIPNDYSDLERQIKLYHATSFGNGNYGTNSPNSVIQQRVKISSKAAGYRLILTGGSGTVGTNSISITVNWKNIGQSPTYDNWNITYELVNSSGQVTTLGVSSFKLRLFLPTSSATEHTDVFPLSVSSGTYTLRMVVKDAGGFRVPLYLNVQGRNSDGSYNIKSFQR